MEIINDNIIRASFRVITPMFLSGADQEKAEMRPPSFKGALRFWYRALALSDYKNVDEVYRREQELFGSTNGQAKILLKIDNLPKQDIVVPPNQPWQYGPGSTYLGYGLIKAGRRPVNERGFFQSFTFNATLLCKKDASPEDIDLVSRSLRALGLLGGIGARSRKGFGSLSLISLEGKGLEKWQPPTNIDQLANEIRRVLTAKLYEGIPEYTAFSTETQIVFTETGNNPMTLLRNMGDKMLEYRRYEFPEDKRPVLAVINSNKPDTHPKRVAFGLPHNYFFKHNNKNCSVKPSPKLERRASPLFIHIHELSNNNYVGILTLLPARFLPERDSISIGGKTVALQDDISKYTVIRKFMGLFPGRTVYPYEP